METITLVLTDEEYHFLKAFFEFGLKKLSEDPTKPYILRIQQRMMETYMRSKISDQVYKSADRESRNAEVKIAPF